MMYDYLCQGCGRAMIDDLFNPIGGVHKRVCPGCGGLLRRAAGHVAVVRGMNYDFQPHFNNTIGGPVTSMRDFREKLKLKAVQETEATGMYHEYKVIDPRDRYAFGMTDADHEIVNAVNSGFRAPVELTDAEAEAADGGWGEPPPLEGERT